MFVLRGCGVCWMLVLEFCIVVVGHPDVGGCGADVNPDQVWNTSDHCASLTPWSAC